MPTQTQDVLLTRATVHDFKTDPLPAGLLHDAVEAALAAPNHRLTEPWRFIHAGPALRNDLAEIGTALKLAKSGDAPGSPAVQAVRRKLLDPPELLVALQVLAPDEVTRREDYAALACALQNLSLSLWARGVGSKWSSGGVTTDPRTYARLEVDPATHTVAGFVWIGYPLRPPTKPRRRLGVGGVLRAIP